MGVQLCSRALVAPPLGKAGGTGGCRPPQGPGERGRWYRSCAGSQTCEVWLPFLSGPASLSGVQWTPLSSSSHWVPVWPVEVQVGLRVVSLGAACPVCENTVALSPVLQQRRRGVLALWPEVFWMRKRTLAEGQVPLSTSPPRQYVFPGWCARAISLRVEGLRGPSAAAGVDTELCLTRSPSHHRVLFIR